MGERHEVLGRRGPRSVPRLPSLLEHKRSGERIELLYLKYLMTPDACRPRMMPCVDVLLTLFGARAAVMVRYFCVHTLASLLEGP